ncbi:MAG TPA: hypothetical protein DCE55_10475 [Planctomycetaceae bacterium]|nr:hypothetical protein [Planctomycetaceae bacterium]
MIGLGSLIVLDLPQGVAVATQGSIANNTRMRWFIRIGYYRCNTAHWQGCWEFVVIGNSGYCTKKSLRLNLPQGSSQLFVVAQNP